MIKERTRELAKQAGFSIEALDAQEVFVVEKFAKLIIKECASINDRFIGHRIGEVNLDVIYEEHFGTKQ